MTKGFVILSLAITVVATARVVGEPGVEWHLQPGCRWIDLNVPKSGQTGFTLLSPQTTGINFTNVLAEQEGAANRVLWSGSGVAVGDYDNDGLPDLFFCGLDTPNALYRNLGEFRFTNVTRQSGLERPGSSIAGRCLPTSTATVGSICSSPPSVRASFAT